MPSRINLIIKIFQSEFQWCGFFCIIFVLIAIITEEGNLNFNNDPGEDYSDDDKLQLPDPSFAQPLSKPQGGIPGKSAKIKYLSHAM